MNGRVCMITGATSGIGRATAVGLAGRGADLVLVCRDLERGNDTRREIRERTGSESVELLQADLASQAEIRKLAADFLASDRPLHVLVNNVGVVHARHSRTVDGIETTFAVNHLAPFLLTNLLLERIRSSAPARIVNVGSEAYRAGGALDFDDLSHERRFRPWTVYGRSKLANLLFTLELAARLEASGVTVNCLHPGGIASGLGVNRSPLLGLIARVVVHPFLKTPEQGADTPIWLVSSDEVADVSGEYFADRKRLATSRIARDREAAARLWRESASLTGLAS